MKGLFSVLLAGLILVASGSARADDWKGQPDPSQFGLGALTGMGVIDNHVGFALLGAASKKILDTGFVSDVNNSVWIEAELGPVFISGSTAFAYSAHLRWDFIKDPTWTLYALGGLAGNITGTALGDHFELYPRFGVGAMMNLVENMSLRAEISHEFIVVGVNFAF